MRYCTIQQSVYLYNFPPQEFAVGECARELDDHQKHFFMEMVSDCWLFVRLQVRKALSLSLKLWQ